MFIAGMNIFVAFFVLLLLLAESTPPAASSIPLIGMCLIYIGSCSRRFVILQHYLTDYLCLDKRESLHDARYHSLLNTINLFITETKFNFVSVIHESMVLNKL